MDSQTLATTAAAAAAASVATGKLTAPMDTFNEVWRFVLGPIDDYLIKHNAKRAYNRQKYLEEILERKNEIPLENVQVPPLSLVGPALEASKYYIDEEELRSMFAKLIGSSFDNRKNALIHHAYIEILKQMNPLDAKILKTLPNISHLVSCVVPLENHLEIVHMDMYLSPEFPQVQPEVIISMNNLERLGIINVTHNAGNIKIQSGYDPAIQNFKSTDLYKYLQTQYPNRSFDVYTEPCYLTQLGRSFRDICISSSH